MTTSEVEPTRKVEVDKDGYRFVELGDLESDWKHMREMIERRDTLDAAIARVRAFFEKKMAEADADGFMINGVRRVSYKKDATFPSAKFIEECPAIAAAYMTTKEVLDVAALKQHRPQDYANWRGRSFKSIQNPSA